VTDAAAQLRSATRRAKSDVANKLVSMFLHELSRKMSQRMGVRVDSEEYGALVRECFGNQCPYCRCDLSETQSVVEHLDGMNRYRVGLHIPGNVLVACRRCNGEKRRDDSLASLSLADSGWASFLSHDGAHCAAACLTCKYWSAVWPVELERKARLSENRDRIGSFRSRFPELERINSQVAAALPPLVVKLYADCQAFAEHEIRSLLERYSEMDLSGRRNAGSGGGS
jgi:hypothetical protein